MAVKLQHLKPMTNRAKINSGNIVEEGPGIWERNNYNPIAVSSELSRENAKMFSLGVGAIKTKIKEDEEVEYLSERVPFTDLSETDKERVLKHTEVQKHKNIGTKFFERTSEGLIRGGENINNIELWRPDVGVIEIIKDGKLDNIETYAKTIKAVTDTAFNNLIGFDDYDEFNESVKKITYPAMDKIMGSMDGDKSSLQRLTEILGGTVELGFSGVGAMADYEGGAGGITSGALVTADSLAIPVQSAVIETSMALGASEEMAGDIGTIMEVFIPGKVLEYKIKGIGDIRANKLAVDGVKKEITNIFKLEPDVRDSYISAKKEQYGNFSYIKGVEKFDNMLEEAKISGNVKEINNIKTEIKSFNDSAKNNIKTNIKNNIGASLDNLADKMGVRLAFTKNGKDVTSSLDFSEISFGKGSDKFHKIDVNRKAVGDLTKFWSDKGLGELKRNEIKASIDQYFKETALTDIQKKTFAGDLWRNLQEERIGQSKSIQDLYNISLEKSRANKNYKKAKDDFSNGVINKQKLLNFKKARAKTFDTFETPKKLEELKYQEALGHMKFVDKGGDLIGYERTDKGLKFMKPEVRPYAVGYHISKDLYNKVESKGIDKVVNKIVKKKEVEFEDLIKTAKKEINPLHKAYKESKITWKAFKQNEIQKVLNNKKGLSELKGEIDGSVSGSRVFVESDKGGSPDIIGLKSSFPKWLPEHLRNKEVMEKVYAKLEKGELDIPDKNIVMQETMGTYLDKLNSKLKDMYEVDFEKISDNKLVEKNKVLTEHAKQSKDVMNAIHSEYKKQKKVVETGNQKLIDVKQKLKKTRDTWKEKYQYKADSNKRRRNHIQTMKKAYELSDGDFKKALSNMERKGKSKDYLTFTHQFEFEKFTEALEVEIFRLAEEKAVKLEVLAKINNKELNNLKNLLSAYELPSDLNKFTVDDLLKLDKILDNFEVGDSFLSKSFIKRFEVIGEKDIKTIREAKEEMTKDLGILYEMDMVDFEKSLYTSRISELKEQIGESLNDGSSKEKRAVLEEELELVEKEQKQNAFKDKVNQKDFKTDKEKTTHEKVKADKLIKGNWTDPFAFDHALSQKNLLYKFMVQTYKMQEVKTKANLQRLQDKLGDKLKLARESRKRGFMDRLIPTDNKVFEFLEAGTEKKVELSKTMTPEELDLANFVKDTFSYFRGELSKNKVMDNFKQNYMTNLQKGVAEVYKDRGIKEAVKQIFKTEDNVLDFGAIGEADQVLGFEKFFKFGLERTKDFDPSKDIGKAVMAYANTFYKKQALDNVIPKVALYKNILADSKASKTITSWINNKKGITAMPNLQGTGLETIVKGLQSFVSLMDLGFSPITAGASAGGVLLSNVIALNPVGVGKGLKRKYSKQGKEILKKYEAEIGRNPLWNVHKEILNAPDVTPLEVPGQLAFVMLGQTMQSGLNTAFLSKLTKKEFNSGDIPSSRISEIFNELGATHALPGTNSIYGNTLFGKLMMMYKSWAIPLIYTNKTNLGKVASHISGKKKMTKAESYQFINGWMLPISLLVMANKIMGDEDPDDRFAYHKKRILQELTSSIGAIDPDMWLATPRVSGFLLQTYKSLQELRRLDEYAQTKDGEYEKGDLKGWKHLSKQYTPAFIKAFKSFDKKPPKTSSKKSTGLSGLKIKKLNLGGLKSKKLNLKNLKVKSLNLKNLKIR